MFQGGEKQHAHVPSGYVKIAIENDHLQWIYPLKMVIFRSYVSLPEGNWQHSQVCNWQFATCFFSNRASAAA